MRERVRVTRRLPRELAAAERAVRRVPNDGHLRDVLIHLYAERGLAMHPRCSKHILWLVRHAPRASGLRSPVAPVDWRQQPRTFAVLERLWRKHHDAHPRDPRITTGFALFMLYKDRAFSLRLLEDFVAAEPQLGSVWRDLGRIRRDSRGRLDAFMQARRLGEQLTPLAEWIGKEAVACNEWNTVRTTGEELLAEAAQLRERHGERLEWSDDGCSLYERAREVLPTSEAAREFVRAHMNYADHTHWGHTFVGLVALRQGATGQALEHLRASSLVTDSPRLASYGPSFLLASELDELGYHAEVEAYIESCASFAPSELLAAWRTALVRSEIPGDQR